VEEVIERSFKLNKSEKPDICLINLLLETRKCSNIFQLLKFEEKKIIARDAELQFQDGPALTWELTNFGNNYYKESEPFLIDGHAFKLSIQYLSEILLLKLSSVDISHLRSSSNKSGLPIDFFQSYSPKPDNILSSMYTIEIGSFKMEAPQVTSIFEDGVSYVEMLNLPDFDYETYIEGGSLLRIQLYFKLKYTHSAIMSQIAKNFNFYHTDKGIKLLREEHLIFFYKFDYLEVMSEDQVLISFVNWYVQNQKELKLHTVSDILDNIRWNHVTIKTLHSVMIQHQEIKENNDMKRVFKNELERRVRELMQEREGSEMYGVYLQKREPRKSYFNFMRPETTNFLFDFLYNKLLEVPPQPEAASSDQTDDTVLVMSKNSSVDPSNNNINAMTQKRIGSSISGGTRYRGQRRRFAPDESQTPQNKKLETLEDDDLSDGNDIDTKSKQMAPLPDQNNKNMKTLFKDDDSDGPDAGDPQPDFQDDHAYKGPPNMASFDVPNGTFGDGSRDHTPSLNDLRTGIGYRIEDGDSSARVGNLFDRKVF